MNPFAASLWVALFLGALKLTDTYDAASWLVLGMGIPMLGLWAFLMLLGGGVLVLAIHEWIMHRRPRRGTPD